MLKINNLSFSYHKNKDVLMGISFEVKNENIVVLLGPNGSGKSTLLKCILSLNKVRKGDILYNDKSILNISPSDRAKLISYVPQENVSSSLTIYEVILLGRLPYITFYESKEDIEIVNNIIKDMGLEDIKDKRINETSLGQRQKVMIAKALAQKSEIILLDEPMNNLDIENQLELIKTIKSLEEKEHKLVIITLHDIDTALSLGTKFIMLKNGELRYFGDESIITKESIKEIFNVDIITKDIDGKRRIFYED